MNQRLSNLVGVAEIVGSFAIVVTLIVLTVEMKNNTAAIEISAYQDLTFSITELNAIAIQNEGAADILFRANTDPDSLSEVEEYRFRLQSINVFRHGDMAYFQYKRGAIDKAELDSLLRILIARLAVPLIKEQWGQVGAFGSDYMEYVEALYLESTGSAL